MNKVTLFRHKHPEIETCIQAYFNEEGELIIDGYDIGNRVKEIWGESDYEYAYRINPDSVKQLYNILGLNHGDKLALLEAIKSKFNDNSAYTELGKFMDENLSKQLGTKYFF
jgi:hypothetical protein